MASVGEMLRRERERQGLDLATIAQQTRIKERFLEALERDDFASLPGRFFVRAFAIQYAKALGIADADIQAALERQMAPAEALSHVDAERGPGGFTFEKPFSVEPLPEGTASAVTGRKLAASALVLVAVVAGCAAIFWFWQRSQLSSTSANAAPQAELSHTKSLPAPAPTAAEPPASGLSPDAVMGAQSQPSPVTTTPPAHVPPSASPSDESASEQQEGRIRIAVAAKEEVWVRITVDGKVLTERVLAPGETRSAAAYDSITVLVGNAGGVEIRYNGTSIGTIGPRGQVRTVEFTPQSYRIIEPQKRLSAPDAGQ